MGMCSRRLELRGAAVGAAWRHLFDSKIKGNGSTGRGEQVDEGPVKITSMFLANYFGALF